MKKFAFALDKVLEFKRQYEDSIRNEHAAIMHEIRLQEERFAELSAKDKEIRDQMRREQVTQRLKNLRFQEEQKRRELIAAKTDTTSIDKLKDKKLEEYNYLAQKEQEQLIEEFVNHGLMAAR